MKNVIMDEQELEDVVRLLRTLKNIVNSTRFEVLEVSLMAASDEEIEKDIP